MADRGPVKIREGKIDELTNLYKETYKKLAQEIVTASDAGKIQKAKVMARINYELKQLGIDADKVIREEISKYYYDGANQALEDLRKLDIDLSAPASAAINREAVRALVDETAALYADSIIGVSRNASNIVSSVYRQQLNYILAEGKLTGSTRRLISKAVTAQLQESGIGALTDKAGRSWSLERYSAMLVRTKGAEARNQGLANKMVSYGYDLVQVSRHGSKHKACRDLEGKILSLTGATPKGTKLPGGYVVWGTLAEARSAGLFHPNCEHAINVFTPELASKTKAYDNPYLKMTQEEQAAADIAFRTRAVDTL